MEWEKRERERRGCGRDWERKGESRPWSEGERKQVNET